MEEQPRGFGDLTTRIGVLDQKVDRLQVELSVRIDALGEKVDRVRVELCARVDALDQKISSQFIWLVGIQVAVLLAVVGALLLQ